MHEPLLNGRTVGPAPFSVLGFISRLSFLLVRLVPQTASPARGQVLLWQHWSGVARVWLPLPAFERPPPRVFYQGSGRRGSHTR